MVKTSYLPQQIYVNSDTKNNGSVVDGLISNNDPTMDQKSVSPILYGHHMFDLEGSNVLKFKGCCWDGAEYNLQEYNINLRSVLRLHQGLERFRKYVGDKFEMLVTDLVFFATKILVNALLHENLIIPLKPLKVAK